MNEIKVLPELLINQIAAGEVVERPASVVKELVENAVDAGAAAIQVAITKGGTESIQVIDDGCGIPADQLMMAFERHATSKISTEDDLWQLSSMGFRGEALPSIASVSRMEVISNAGGGGHELAIHGGHVGKVRPAAFPGGTSMLVKELFFNTPARKKFLKSTITEAGHVYDTILRLALAFPHIAFTYTSEGKNVFITSGDGSVRSAALAIYGRDYIARMNEIDAVYGSIRVEGLIGSTNHTKKNRKGQQFFVNRRPVRNAMLSAALEEGYRGFLVGQERPIAIISLTLSGSDVDVNVHPQKAEVKFSDEQAVFQAVRRTVREQLLRMEGYDAPTGGIRTETAAQSSYSRPVATAPLFEKTPFQIRETAEQVYYKPMQAGDDVPKNEAGPAKTFAEAWPEDMEIQILGQWQQSFIICILNGKLEIIDQHAAHERVMYNRICGWQKGVLKQDLFIPAVVEAGEDVIMLLENNQDYISRIGFDIDRMGERSLVIRSAPVMVAGNEIETLLEIVEALADGETAETLLDSGLKIVACKAAIKAGQELATQEMKSLLREWLVTEQRGHCPHGRPVSVTLERAQVERMLKR